MGNIKSPAESRNLEGIAAGWFRPAMFITAVLTALTIGYGPARELFSDYSEKMNSVGPGVLVDICEDVNVPDQIRTYKDPDGVALISPDVSKAEFDYKFYKSNPIIGKEDPQRHVARLCREYKGIPLPGSIVNPEFGAKYAVPSD